jgi:hypothetical protein
MYKAEDCGVWMTVKKECGEVIRKKNDKFGAFNDQLWEKAQKAYKDLNKGLLVMVEYVYAERKPNPEYKKHNDIYAEGHVCSNNPHAYDVIVGFKSKVWE